MGLQGNEATHDFLSLYAAAAKDSSIPCSKPLPPPAQGFFLKTHDFLQPLERPSPSPPPPPPPPAGADKQLHQHALPGGIGTYSIGHAVPAAGAVKQEPPPFALWGQAAAADPRGHQWTLPFAARSVAVASSRPQQQPERKGGGGGGFMDAGSRSSGGAGFDDDDGLAARREVSSSLKELPVRVEGKGGSCSGNAGTDQQPNTPRSKHSATEQRRRSKINDGFQVLRELLPDNDQKRDKASFLLEVIEYIRFLQEKVQKYEVSYPEWNQENAKTMPWANIYFRSFRKNEQDQTPGDTSPEPSQIIKNGSSSGFPFTGKPDDNKNVVASPSPSVAHDQTETDPTGRTSYKSAETPSSINVADNVMSQPLAHETRSSPAEDRAVNSEMLNNPESSPAEDRAVNSEMLNNPELAIDEGRSAYQANIPKSMLLSTLNHTLQNSGIDLSQASISVQINLGKQAIKRSAPGATSTSKELMDPASNSQAIGHQLRLGDGAQELLQATKRHRSDNS